ncbi:MAG: hypothetical protein LOD89_06800, partial [Tissierellales bacterium]
MKHIKLIGKSLILILLVVVAILNLYFYKLLKADYIYKRIKIDGFDVSYMSRDEALNFIKGQKEKYKYSTLKLIYYDKVFEIQ